MLQSGSTPVSSGRSRKHVRSLPLLFAEQEISIKGGLHRRRQRRGLSGSNISRGVPGQTVLPNVVSRYGRSGLRRAGNSISDRDTRRKVRTFSMAPSGTVHDREGHARDRLVRSFS